MEMNGALVIVASICSLSQKMYCFYFIICIQNCFALAVRDPIRTVG